eukprot:6134715-Pyramimonas_sp.AAC.1
MSARHFRREYPQGDGGGRGPSIHLAQTDSDIQCIDWGSLLADPADSSVAVVNIMAVRYLSASVFLEFCRRAVRRDWLGITIVGEPAVFAFGENFHVPAEGDDEMAGAPAESEAIIPATQVEMQLMLYLRVIGNPTNMELSDDGHLRGNPRD